MAEFTEQGKKWENPEQQKAAYKTAYKAWAERMVMGQRRGGSEVGTTDPAIAVNQAAEGLSEEAMQQAKEELFQEALKTSEFLADSIGKTTAERIRAGQSSRSPDASGRR